MDPIALLQEFVSLAGPPGQEEAVRLAVAKHVERLGYDHETDAKGNLLVRTGELSRPRIMVTAHMDEIAMIVRRIEPDGRLIVAPMGGIYNWKLGESPVQILAKEPLDGVFSFGSIHTADPTSIARRSEKEPITWEMGSVFTGLPVDELRVRGVRPGTRVVVHPNRRNLLNMGPFVAGHFLDDRADIVSMLLVLEAMKDDPVDALFVASAAEEVGGEGALFVMNDLRPDVCIALELAAVTKDAPIELNDQPVVWATDSYSTMAAADGDLLAELGEELGMRVQFQSLSRGGSDASCAAGHGACGRPITLGLPMENSHGFEIMHPNAMAELARLTVALLRRL